MRDALSKGGMDMDLVQGVINCPIDYTVTAGDAPATYGELSLPRNMWRPAHTAAASICTNRREKSECAGGLVNVEHFEEERRRS